MSLLQNQDFVLYRIRNRYLHCMRDGVGERLITVNPAALNVPAFKNAGWGCPSEIRRTYSPPIPVGASTEYFTTRAPLSNRDAESPVPSLQQHYQQQQVGGVDLGRSFMRPGLASHFSNGDIDTVDTGFTGNTGRLEEVKERVRREHHGDREDDSSDMSEESEDEETGPALPQKTQFDFAKKEIPQRPRSGSSPLRSGPRVPDSSATRSRVRRVRGGSHGDVDFNGKSHHTSNSLPKPSGGILPNGLMGASERLHAEITDKLHSSPNSSSLTHTSSFGDDDDDSDASSLDSDFTETADSDPTSVFSHKEGIPSSPGIFHALPPPIRPVSMVQPVSVLTQLLKAKESEAANPMEDYQQFAGKGELAPITLKLYIPYSKYSSPFEVIIKRMRKVQSGDTTVAEAIGFTLYKYIEDKKEPELRDELCDINKWVLRMVDDGEPDEDFPPLERTQPITAYIAQGGRRGGRGGVAKLEGEFALVEATAEQYLENERATPNTSSPKKKATPATTTTIATTTATQISAIPTTEIIPPTPSALLPTSSSSTPASIFPIIPPTTTAPVTAAPSKTLRIHISPTSTFAHSIPLSVSTNTPLSTVLQQICQKKSLQPENHILRITNAPTLAILPLTSPVSALGAQTDLDLVRNPTLPLPPPRPPPPPTSPQAPELETYVPPDADYQRFTLYRKSTTPISFLTRHYERVLAIDGEYLHIQSVRKTKSVHVSTIIGAKVCGRGGVGLKIFVWRGGGKESKFEFEASSAEVAEEVVGVVRRGVEGWGGGGRE